MGSIRGGGAECGKRKRVVGGSSTDLGRHLGVFLDALHRHDVGFQLTAHAHHPVQGGGDLGTSRISGQSRDNEAQRKESWGTFDQLRFSLQGNWPMTLPAKRR